MSGKNRAISLGSLLTLVVAGAGAAAGCSDQGSGPNSVVPPGNTAGSPTGTAAGAGTAGSQVGTTGGSGGTAGSGGPAGATSTGGSVGGSAGTTASAGAGGSSGGTAIGGGSNGSGGVQTSGPSPGCLGPGSMDEPGKAVQHDLMVNVADKYKATYTKRKYYTNLPMGYEPTKQYPMVFYGQGCGQTSPENSSFNDNKVLYIQLIPTDATGQSVATLFGAPGCFQAGRNGLADSPDGPYFDQVLAEVEQNFCVDQSKVYVAGWSSGAWLANWLACARGNVITGTISGSGGLFYDHGPCTGGPKAMILDGDAGMTQQDGHEIGAAIGRDILAMAAGAGTTGVDTKYGPDNCQLYAGTKGSVAYCPVGGGHGGPLGTMYQAAWAYWNAP